MSRDRKYAAKVTTVGVVVLVVVLAFDSKATEAHDHLREWMEVV
jgi:hypothetical protein